MNWLTDNRLAIVALGVIAGLVIFGSPNALAGNILSTIAGGIIGFITKRAAEVGTP